MLQSTITFGGFRFTYLTELCKRPLFFLLIVAWNLFVPHFLTAQQTAPTLEWQIGFPTLGQIKDLQVLPNGYRTLHMATNGYYTLTTNLLGVKQDSLFLGKYSHAAFAGINSIACVDTLTATSNPDHNDVLLRKIDSNNGNILWEKVYSDTLDQTQVKVVANAERIVIITAEALYSVTTSTKTRINAMFLDDQGEIESQASSGFIGIDWVQGDLMEVFLNDTNTVTATRQFRISLSYGRTAWILQSNGEACDIYIPFKPAYSSDKKLLHSKISNSTFYGYVNLNYVQGVAHPTYGSQSFIHFADTELCDTSGVFEFPEYRHFQGFLTTGLFVRTVADALDNEIFEQLHLSYPSANQPDFIWKGTPDHTDTSFLMTIPFRSEVIRPTPDGGFIVCGPKFAENSYSLAKYGYPLSPYLTSALVEVRVWQDADGQCSTLENTMPLANAAVSFHSGDNITWKKAFTDANGIARVHLDTGKWVINMPNIANADEGFCHFSSTLNIYPTVVDTIVQRELYVKQPTKKLLVIIADNSSCNQQPYYQNFKKNEKFQVKAGENILHFETGLAGEKLIAIDTGTYEVSLPWYLTGPIYKNFCQHPVYVHFSESDTLQTVWIEFTTQGLGVTSTLSDLGNLKISPNPSSDVFELVGEESISAYWKVLDVTGKCIQSGKMNGTNLSISLSSNPSGMYFFVLTTSESINAFRTTLVKY